MSDGALKGDVLSRDELDALLASLGDERREKDADARPSVRGRETAGRVRSPQYPALARGIEQWATEQARRLSSVYQTVVEFQLSRWEPMTLGELAQTIPPSDALTVLELSPPRATGFLWLGRPLLFSLMALSFGAAGPKAASPLVRPYSRIERRFYRHQSTELLGSLDKAWSELVPTRSRVLNVDDLDRLYEDAHDPVMVATFEVRGLHEFGRMRLALPPGPFASLAGSAGRVAPTRSVELEGAVLDTVVSMRVEAGSAQLTLRELVGLEVGQVLRLESDREGEFVIRIEGVPKFRGLRGAVGDRLAIQVTGPL